MTDDELINGIREGSPEAEQAFDRRFRPVVADRASYHRIPHPENDDVVQRALWQAVKALRAGRFEGRATLETWVFRIGVNACLDYWRQSRRAESDLPMALDAEVVSAPALDPMLRLALERAMATLRPFERVVLMLHLRGWTTDGMAGLVHRPAGTVGRILAQAKKSLRHALSAEGYGQSSRQRGQR